MRPQPGLNAKPTTLTLINSGKLVERLFRDKGFTDVGALPALGLDRESTECQRA
jgi:hypothetical protein